MGGFGVLCILLVFAFFTFTVALKRFCASIDDEEPIDDLDFEILSPIQRKFDFEDDTTERNVV